MKAITKIMVACDLSKYSKETLEYAAHLAEKLQAELIIVNVINQRDIDIILKVAEGQFDRSIETYVEKSAEEYVKRVKEERTREIEKLIKATSPENLSVKKNFQNRCAISGTHPGSGGGGTEYHGYGSEGAE